MSYPNSAIDGYDNLHLTGVSVDDCKAACCAEVSFPCMSFDYDKATSECDLSSATAPVAGGLKSDYAGNPYDHYEFMLPVVPIPSAMPNPPGYKPPPRRTWRKFGEVSARGHPHFDRPQAFHQFCFAMGLTRDPGD